MDAMRSDAAARVPHESPTLGATHASAGSTLFGYDWMDRTYGLSVIKIVSSADGVVSIDAVPHPTAARATFQSTYGASKTVDWLELVGDEYLTEVQLYIPEQRDRIAAVCFVTNYRRSQWFGKCDGKMEKLVAPPGSYLHMLHGANGNGTCERMGAYMLPLSLLANQESQCVTLMDSEGIERVPFDASSPVYFESSPGDVRAVVVALSDSACTGVHLLSTTEYLRHLAVRDTPLPLGVHVLVLVNDEWLTGLHAYEAQDCIVSLQWETTLRTTEWFGPIPSDDDKAAIKTLEVDRTLSVMCIGGVFGMLGSNGDCIQSIHVEMYQCLCAADDD